MGNQQYCCKYKGADEHAKEYGTSPEKQVNNKMQKGEQGKSNRLYNNKLSKIDEASLKATMDAARNNTKLVVKIQANIRGYLSRHKNRKIDQNAEPKP